MHEHYVLAMHDARVAEAEVARRRYGAKPPRPPSQRRAVAARALRRLADRLEPAPRMHRA